MTNPRQAIEARLGIQSVEELLAKRRELVRALAPLRARYGPYGTWDAERKVRLSAIKAKLRAEFARDGARPTEAMLDDEAHAHPDYAEFIVTATRERARWVNGENAVQEIYDLIRRDQSLAHFVAQETRMG